MTTRDKRGLTTYVDEQKTINVGEGLQSDSIGSEVLVSLDIPSLTEDTTPDNSADFTVIYDTSALTHKKVKLENIPASASGSSIASDVQLFTTPGADTWNKPAGARTVYVVCIGGGGGGGSGRKRATGARGDGGGGGGGGGFSEGWFDAAGMSSSVGLVVGAGGAGGAAQTTDSTNGNPGTAGGDSTFGNFLRAEGGTAGLAGGSSSVSAPTAKGSGMRVGGNATGTQNTGLTGNSTTYSSAGGGGGGGVSTGNATTSAAAGGAVAWAANTTGAAGTGGASGTAGTAGSSNTVGAPGGGGGGGGGGTSGSGGNGGAGGTYGGGGGGGGAATNGGGNNSGAGGAGADGCVMVVTFF